MNCLENGWMLSHTKNAFENFMRKCNFFIYNCEIKIKKNYKQIKGKSSMAPFLDTYCLFSFLAAGKCLKFLISKNSFL